MLKPQRCLGVGVLLATTLAGAAAGAVVTEEEQRAEDAAVEARRVENLMRLAPDAVGPFTAGSQALADERFDDAERLLGEARELVPGFTVATQRLCRTKARLGKRAEALALCREAAGDESADSLAELALVLVSPDATPAEIAEAHEASARAVQRDPKSWRAQQARSATARRAGDLAAMRAAVTALEELGTAKVAAEAQLARGWLIVEAGDSDAVKLDEAAYSAHRAAKHAPASSEPAMLLATVALARNDMQALRAAVAELEGAAPADARTQRLAVLLALAEGDLDRAEAALARARAAGLPAAEADALAERIGAERPFYAAWLRAGAWGLAGLAAVALALVGAGLHLGRRAEEPGLRGLYAFVLRATWLAYHAVVVVAVSLVAASGAALAITLVAAAKVMTVRQVAVVGLAAVGAVGVLTRSVLRRAPPPDAGLELELEEHPRLAELLGEVAERVGAPPLDVVHLTARADLEALEHRGTRHLYLGAGLLDGLELPRLRALLASACGELVRGGETAGGAFAIAVHRSLERQLAASPPWSLHRVLVSGFGRLFARISLGARRLQAELADRWAAAAYGSRALAEGLRFAAERRACFSVSVEPGDYRDILARPADDAAVERELAPLRERIARIEALGLAGTKRHGDGDGWSLLADRRELEERLVDDLRLEVQA
jgi:hypothetical protein